MVASTISLVAEMLPLPPIVVKSIVDNQQSQIMIERAAQRGSRS
jgi:hypothetical protein